MAKLTEYVVAFNSEESRATKNVAFIEGNFGYPKKDIEVRTKVPQLCYADCKYYGTGMVEDCKLSPRLYRNPKKCYRKHTQVLPESHFMAYVLIYLSASSRKLAWLNRQRTGSILMISLKRGLES